MKRAVVFFALALASLLLVGASVDARQRRGTGGGGLPPRGGLRERFNRAAAPSYRNAPPSRRQVRLPRASNFSASRGNLRREFNRAAGRRSPRQRFNTAAAGRRRLRQTFNRPAGRGRLRPTFNRAVAGQRGLRQRFNRAQGQRSLRRVSSNAAAQRNLRRTFNRTAGRGQLRQTFNRRAAGQQTLRRKFNDVAQAGRLSPRPKPAGTSSRPLIPGGGLLAHEKAGGHTIERHVGKSEQFLRDRLATDKKISAASSFYDQATAETAISRVLEHNSVKMSGWLAGKAPRATLTGTLERPVGISIPRGRSNATHVSGVRIIVERAPNMPTGYKIVTAYPE